MTTNGRGKNLLTGVWIVSSLATLALIAGCGNDEKVQARTPAKTEQAGKVTPEERRYLDAAKPFAEAVAARDYRKAYEFLSSHAKAKMSPNQFVAPADDATGARNDVAAVSNPSAEKFAQMLVPTENEYGKPTKLFDAQVFSTDPVALSGKGTSIENKLDSMFAIGMMPATIPEDVRKASVRSKLLVEFSPQQWDEAAKSQQTTPDKLKADPDFKPYVNLKIVLVQDGGALKVGYFEFLPPGILD